ncbi:MAG: YggS family pyridoxal phosphate-dependent enzyme [Candidatus Desulforudis sp.]|nr:YggS family pyridoxal phosphate-dependent enzyme [Desulforudis sp.]
MDVAQNLERVRHKIAAACRRSGLGPEDVELVAVTKDVGLDAIKQALDAGVKVLGENRVQELVRKYPELPGVRWHFIGHLQRNKVKPLVGRVELIHSMDRWSLAQELDRQARRFGRVFRVLVQVNVTGEAGRFGVPPGDLIDFVNRAAGLEGLRVEGLMVMAPFVTDPEEVRPLFREMRGLFERLSDDSGVRMRYLSMGMSSDYTVAVEEGANMVRIGTAVFGPRKCTLRGD